MRKKWTRFLGFLASTSLVVGMMPVAAFAKTEDTGVGQPFAAPAATTTAEIQTMENDVYYDVALQRDEYWVGKFTAPSDGRYDFFSDKSESVVCGELYADADLTEPVDVEQTGGCLFRFEVNLSANQTVYLKVNEVNNDVMNCAVKALKYDEANLHYGNLYLAESELLHTGSPVEIEAEVTDHQGIQLTEGTDYEVVYVNGDEESLTPPTEVGLYYVYARAIGDAYSGATFMQMVRIHDKMNIDAQGWYEYFWDWDGNIIFDHTGEPVVLPELVISHYDSKTETSTLLKENVDFKFSRFETYEGKVLKSAPSEIGGYIAVYEGINPYKGEYRRDFLIQGDGYDLELATVHIGDSAGENRMDYTGKSVLETLEIYAREVNGGTLDPDESYDLVFYDSTGTQLDSAPSEIGTYFVAARAKNGTDYRGETPKKRFYICGTNDIGNSRFTLIYQHFSCENYPYTGEAVEFEQDLGIEDNGESDYVELVKGTDFVLDHIEDANGNVIVGPIKDIGEYYAIYKGCGAYSGYREFLIRVSDPYDMYYVELNLGDEFTGWLIDGKVDLPVSVVDLNGNVLTPETDYRLGIVHKKSDEEYIEVDTISEPGDYYIYAKEGSNGKYPGESRIHFWFVITDKVDIAAWEGRFSPINEVQVGSTTLPDPEITYQTSTGTMKLVENEDYELSYISNYEDTSVKYGKNIPAETGYYQAVYTGKGDTYIGEKAIPFYVVDELTDYSDISMWHGSLARDAMDLGDPQLPTMEVYRNEGNETIYLTEGTDYQLDHIEKVNGKNYGTSIPNETGYFHVYYKGIGEYSGTVFVGLRIYDPKDISTWDSYFLNAHGKGSFGIIDAGSGFEPRIYRSYQSDGSETYELTEGKDFVLDHFEDEEGKNLGAEVPDVDGVYIACYTAKGELTGTNRIWFYLNGCEPKTYSIEKAEVSLGATKYTYDGKEKSPGVKTVTVNGKTLVEGKDYTVKVPTGRKDAGTYTYIITGKGNYTGTTKASFVISKASSSIQIKALSKTYNGKAQAYSGKMNKSGSTGKVTYTYYSDRKGKKAVKPGDVKAAKTYYVRATLAADANHESASSKLVKFSITKAKNPMTVKTAKKTVNRAKLTKKNGTFAVFTVKNNQGKLFYKLMSVQKTKYKKYFSVNQKTGNITVKRGIPKGTYIISVKIAAKGNSNYKAVTKTVKVKITVK